MWNKVLNRVYDTALGVETGGVVETNIPDGGYATTDYLTIIRVLNRLELTSDDVFLDVGCGKGRVVCLAARRQVRSAGGIELSPELVAIASANLDKRLRGRIAEGHILLQDATTHRYDDTTVAYLFSPFHPAVLGTVLTKIRADRGNRRFRCAFVNLRPPDDVIFRKQDWLRCAARWVEKKLAVAVYKSRD